jgi:hypothetical protein
MTDIATVRDQARQVARGWSGANAPESWSLTATMFETLAEDDGLLDLASGIPADRLPALVFVASVRYLAVQYLDDPFAAYFPVEGADVQPALDAEFGDHYRRFCDQHRDELRATWSQRLYQMNEVARCAQVALALAVLHEMLPGRTLGIIDIGTSAGFGQLVDQYCYRYSDGTLLGDAASSVQIDCRLEGGTLPTDLRLPSIQARVGIDRNPIDVDDQDARAWLAACLPPEVGAQRRARAAMQAVRNAKLTIIRGDVLERFDEATEVVADADVVVFIDTFTTVFFEEAERRRLRNTITHFSPAGPVAWISLDPLVPLGTSAQQTVHGVDAPARLIDDNRLGGVFGVLTLALRSDGRQDQRILAKAHPSGTRMHWLANEHDD